MSVTQLIWIGAVVVFLIVGMSISNAISALAHQIGENIKVELDSVKVELDNDSLPLRVELDIDPTFLPLKVQLDNHALPLKVQLDMDPTRPLKIALDNPLRTSVRSIIQGR